MDLDMKWVEGEENSGIREDLWVFSLTNECLIVSLMKEAETQEKLN